MKRFGVPRDAVLICQMNFAEHLKQRIAGFIRYAPNSTESDHALLKKINYDLGEAIEVARYYDMTKLVGCLETLFERVCFAPSRIEKEGKSLADILGECNPFLDQLVIEAQYIIALAEAEQCAERLGDNERYVLIELYNREAFDCDRRVKAEDIGNDAYDPPNLKRATSSLSKKGLIVTEAVRGGGMWLTPQGQERAARIIAAKKMSPQCD